MLKGNYTTGKDESFLVFFSPIVPYHATVMINSRVVDDELSIMTTAATISVTLASRAPEWINFINILTTIER